MTAEQVQNERRAFEAWAQSLELDISLSRRTEGMYASHETSVLWEGWLARAYAEANGRLGR